jgi:glycerol kinase
MTSKSVLLGVDQGTTNTKALVIDESGAVVGSSSRPIAIQSPASGIVEQDAAAMFANVVTCAAEALAAAGRTASDVVGLGVSNQTETLVIWDRASGQPVMPAMVWQCRRGQDEIEPLRVPEKLALIRARTGIDLDPTFTAAKLRWVAANRPDIMRGLSGGKLLWGNVDCWLRWKITGGRSYATEPSNAARTMLYDIDRHVWDPELAELFELSLPYPDVTPTAGQLGTADTRTFGAAIPVAAFLGDQQASLFGHGCHAQGETKITYGTGAFVWMNKGTEPPREVPDGLLRTIAWQIGQTTYAFEGFIMYAGAILDWLAERLNFVEGAAGVAEAAADAGTSAEVVLVPAFQGLAGPWWQPEARAVIAGLSQATQRGHIAHAALESVAWQVRVLLEGMGGANSVSVDGGLTRSDYFLRLQSDALGTPLSRAVIAETSPYGAALAAGLGAGVWEGPAALRHVIRHEPPLLPSTPGTGRDIDRWRRWIEAAIALARNP